MSVRPWNLVGGVERPLETVDADIISVNPARPDEVVWSARSDPAAVDAAVAAARAALDGWR
ncbi:MAG: hypothetical protein RL461_289, partial [Planctomycetota bacterium]